METSPASRPAPAPAAKTPGLAGTLAASSMYQSYERAFCGATGLPVALDDAGSWQLPFRGRRNENAFCALMAQRNGACAACLRMQEALAHGAADGPCTKTCHFGLTESAVPVRNGSEIVALLRTGQVFRKPPGAAQFRGVAKKLRALGVPESPELESAYLATLVVEPKRYESAVGLLTLFGQHLSAAANELLVQQANAEPPIIARAKEYIRAHTADDLSLGDVARAVHASPSYFCRLFKKATGINFNQYVSRVRLERAKQLLLNPNLRVSEIAYEVGFQSLTHFNRVFKKLLGESPTEYRGHLCAV